MVQAMGASAKQERAGELRYIYAARAESDEREANTVATVIAALDSVDSAVIQLSSMITAKFNGELICRYFLRLNCSINRQDDLVRPATASPRSPPSRTRHPGHSGNVTDPQLSTSAIPTATAVTHQAGSGAHSRVAPVGHTTVTGMSRQRPASTTSAVPSGPRAG